MASSLERKRRCESAKTTNTNFTSTDHHSGISSLCTGMSTNQKPQVAERKRERDVFLLYASAFEILEVSQTHLEYRQIKFLLI